MFNYPYGDNQQINLNWIISEIIALHQRLDPDYTAPTFTQIYPFSDTQQLNLDWILTELKALKDLAPTPPPIEEIDEIGQALIAGAYDATTSYQKNDYIVQDGKLYRANAATTGTFDPTKWREVMLGDDLAIITRWADATNTYLNSLAASNVANDSSVTGTTVKDALNTLKNAVPEMTTDNVTNESGVTGATTTAALNTLNGAIGDVADDLSDEVTARQNAIANINKFEETETINLDDETRPFVYFSAASTGTRPFEGIGYLITLVRSTTAKTQFAWFKASTEINLYMRRMYSGVWGGWQIVGENPTNETIQITVSSSDTRLLNTSTAQAVRYGNVVFLDVALRFDFSSDNLEEGENVTATLTGVPAPIFQYSPRVLAFQSTRLAIVWLSGSTISVRAAYGTFVNANTPIAAGIVYITA